jgi:hypothetical protein
MITYDPAQEKMYESFPVLNNHEEHEGHEEKV